jgi:quinol monooxygenase YgiN
LEVYARSTTVQAQPGFIDAGIAHMRDKTMPALQAIDGFVGLSLLVDRESGRCIATSAWESEEAMRATTEQVRPIRDSAVQVFGGPATIDEWEIAVLHRDHRSGDGACVRATWFKMRPDQFDQAVAYYKTSVLPAIEELEGFCSASLMVDRDSGRAVSSATFDSVEAMERNRDKARSIRTERLRDLGAEQLDVCEFELALAHLRVPEMA